jgi:hypothetical protein
MLLQLFARRRLSFHTCLHIGVLCQPVGFVAKVVSYLAYFGDVSLLGISPVLNLLKKELVFSVFFLDLRKENPLLVVGKPRGSG